MLSGRSRGAYGYAVVDLEATGSSSRRHRVVELARGAARPRPGAAGRVRRPWSTRRARSARPTSTASSRGTWTARRGSPGSRPGCWRCCAAGCWWATTSAATGRSWRAEYARLGLRLPPVPELCTMRIAAAGHGGGPPPYGLSLRGCAAAIGVTGWSPHTALGDARATAALLAHHAPRLAGLPGRWPGPPRCTGRSPPAFWRRRTHSGRSAAGARCAERRRTPGAGARDAHHFRRTKRTPSLCTRSQRHSLASTGRPQRPWSPSAQLYPQEHRGNWPITPTGDPQPRDPRGHRRPAPALPAGADRALRAVRAHGLLRGARRRRRGQLREAAQGLLLPWLLRHPRRRLRRRVPRLPDLPRARPDPGLAGRHRRHRQPGPRARQLRRLRLPRLPGRRPARRRPGAGRQLRRRACRCGTSTSWRRSSRTTRCRSVSSPRPPAPPRRSATGWSPPASPASSTSRPPCCPCPTAWTCARSTCPSSCRSSPSTSSARPARSARTRGGDEPAVMPA